MADSADIQLHYDAEQAVFAAMLGKTMTYSGADWSAADDLESAQTAKLDKLLSFAGVGASTESLLDLGCGWGSLLRRAVTQYPRLSTGLGLTLSAAQRDFAQGLAAGEKIEFRLADCFAFLAEDGPQFDAGVSIGAFEHFADGELYRRGLHRERYRAFFLGCRRRIRGGLGLQTIVSLKKVRSIAAAKRGAYLGFLRFLNREIFPNSLLPTVADIDVAIAGLYRVETIHVTTEHYQKTLSAWRNNLLAHAPGLPSDLCARFERYLTLCIEQFGEGHIGLAQLALRPIS